MADDDKKRDDRSVPSINSLPRNPISFRGYPVIENKESWLQSILVSAMDAIISIDSQHKIIFFNPAAEKLFGYTSSNILGTSISKLIPERYRAKHDDDIRTFSLTGVSSRQMGKLGTVYGLRSNGEEFPLEASISQFEVEGEKFLTVILRDITDQKRWIDQIKLFENMIKSVNDSITFINLEGRIHFVNQAFCKTFGYEEDEIIGQDIQLLFSPDNPGYIRREVFSKTFKTGWSGELLAQKKNGGAIPVYLSTSAIYSAEGKPSGLVIVAIDMTKQKQLEQQVIHSHKMESLRVLVEGIAHNFNNILAIIMGYAALSQRENVSRDKIHDNLNVVLEAVERGSSLVKQLFTFSSLSSERLQNIALNSVITETIDIIQETFPKNISVSLDLASTNPSVAADHRNLRQALLNVLINAQEAMPDGGTITISTQIIENRSPVTTEKKVSDDNDRFVHISITDTGVGMRKELKDRIFEPFYTTKDVGQGMGLGLTITYGIIERYKGYIEVDSAQNRGTTMDIYLPLAMQTDEQSVNKTTPIKAFTKSEKTVLIVEDEDAFRKLLELNLVKLGYTVLTAGDGLEAIEVYEHHHTYIDLILLDIGLPVMGGLTVLQRIREQNTEVKVIIMTGYDVDEIHPNIDELLVSEIVQKPFDIDYMIDLLIVTLEK